MRFNFNFAKYYAKLLESRQIDQGWEHGHLGSRIATLHDLVLLRSLLLNNEYLSSVPSSNLSFLYNHSFVFSCIVFSVVSSAIATKIFREVDFNCWHVSSFWTAAWVLLTRSWIASSVYCSSANFGGGATNKGCGHYFVQADSCAHCYWVDHLCFSKVV